MITAHLPALQVVIPLLAAPVIVLVRNARFAWFLATAVSWVCLAIAVGLLLQVRAAGTISYALGSWQPPWGIEYRVDLLNAFVLVLVSASAAVVAPYMRKSVAAEAESGRIYLFYAMYVLCLGGLLGVAITGDAFNLFVFLEISSLATYGLIAMGRDRRALLAAFQYLIMGTIGATCYVIGVALLFLKTGTLNLADMAARLPEVTEPRAVFTALAFVTVGMSLKLALFPLHFWLPNAYAFAPSAVTAFIAATATKVSVYVLLRYFFTVFGGAPLAPALPGAEVLGALSVIAIVTASLVAVYQADMRRMLAYSSVAQIGYITLGIALASQSGLTGAIVHLFNHGVTKGALFLLLGGIVMRVGGASFDQLAGIARRMPITSFGIVIGGLSLIGVPATAGFVSKWYLVLGAIEGGHWWLAALVVASSLIAVAYVWRFVEAAYFREPAPNAPSSGEAPLSMLAPAWLLVAACIWFGLDTSFNVGSASSAARLLLGTP